MENMLEKMQEVGFQIIAAVGEAKSSYVEAMYLSREGKFDEAEQKIADGDNSYKDAHHFHFELLKKEAEGTELPFSLMLMHAEDQLLTTEVVKLMAVEVIELRKEK